MEVESIERRKGEERKERGRKSKEQICEGECAKRENKNNKKLIVG